MQLPTTCPVIESKVCDHQCPCAACEDMHATYALRTMWRVSESCVHACLGTRRFTSDIERVQRGQIAHHRPSSNFAASARGGDHRRPTEGSAPAERLKRLSSRLAECNRPWVRAVHSTFVWALPCRPEARHEPSIAVCSFFRKSKPLPLGMPIWRCNASCSVGVAALGHVYKI